MFQNRWEEKFGWHKVESSFDVMPQNLIADVKQKFTADSVMAVLMRQACRIGETEVILLTSPSSRVLL